MNWISGGWIAKDCSNAEERDSPGGSGGDNRDTQSLPSRKSSVYLHGKQRLNHKFTKTTSKPTKRTFADRFGFKPKKKEAYSDTQTEAFAYYNSEELEMMAKKKDEMIYFKQKKMVPRRELRLGMRRLTFLLDTLCPGSTPDPLLLGSILDMVS